MSLDHDSSAPTAVQMAVALTLIATGRFVGVPDIDNALMELPEVEVATVLYCTERGYADGDNEIRLTDRGRRFLAILDPKGKS